MSGILTRLTTRFLLANKRIRVWHISPDADIQVLRGRYNSKHGRSGMFVAPSKKAIHRSWSVFVENKKGGKDNRYKSLTLYTLSFPQWVLSRSRQLYDRAYKTQVQKLLDSGVSERDAQLNLFGGWNWDEEVFIPEQLLKHGKIVGRKTKPAPKWVARNEPLNRKFYPLEQARKSKDPDAHEYIQTFELLNRLAIKGALNSQLLERINSLMHQWGRTFLFPMVGEEQLSRDIPRVKKMLKSLIQQTQRNPT
jgi:hypothetical protein